MTILVVAERMGRGGGMERYLQIVLPALAARGMRVHVVARALDDLPVAVTGEQLVWADEHDPPSATASAELARRIIELRPDIAVAHNVLDAGIVATMRTVARFAYHVHDHRPFCPNGDRVLPRSGRNCTLELGNPCALHALIDGCCYGPRLRSLTLIRSRERLRDAVAAADAIVVASGYVAARARDAHIPRDRIVTVPLPLPDDAFSASPPRAAPPRSIIFAGRIVPQKGLGSLVRALAHIDRASRPTLRVFGAGPALAEAQRDAARLGVTVDAPGNVTPASIRDAIDQAALVALPSMWAEPFGYVGIESFARGCPVIAYDVGGIGEWLADGINGRTVARGDEPALGAAIASLLDDEAQRARLGAQARRDAERFRQRPIVDALLDVYANR